MADQIATQSPSKNPGEPPSPNADAASRQRVIARATEAFLDYRYVRARIGDPAGRKLRAAARAAQLDG